MGRKYLEVRRVPLAIRLRQELVNVSKDIPNFRKELEKRAEELFEEWKNSGCE